MRKLKLIKSGEYKKINMEIDEIVQTIENKLKKNGFPENKVSFPKNQIEQFVVKFDYDLEDVLGEMEQNDIFSRRGENKIIFSSEEFNNTPFENSGFDPSKIDPAKLKEMDPQKIREQAADLMKNLSPEQMSDMKKKYEHLSMDEKKKLMDMAKNMGLF